MMAELVLKNLLITIRESQLTTMFRESWWEENGTEIDIMIDPERNTKLSCAIYISSILMLFKVDYIPLAPKRRATIESLVRDFREHPHWYPVSLGEARPGSILIWEERRGNRHIGFYLGDKIAISTSRFSGTPLTHDWLAEADDAFEYRDIIEVFNHRKLHAA